ncbi:hypothetical protein [Agrobacterium rosae]|uniref:hypothetical protein n=1 Tax=Agrobacterium rosae TaxID=1972867 RepID=UPI003A80C213
MRIIFRIFIIIFLTGKIFLQDTVQAEENLVILGPQDEYNVTQDKCLRIKELKTVGFGEENEYGTPDIGVNGSVSLGTTNKIYISGRFDLTFNDISKTDVCVKSGSKIIAYDSLEKLILQKD